jgi:eukaryotic-like serine/threonine-protein kinase
MAIGVPGATPFGGHAGVVKCVAFSPDGATFVTGGEDGVLRLWDLAAREQIAQFVMAREGMRWGKYVWAVAFSPDGGTVITVGGDRAIRLWDADGGSQRAKLDGHTGTVHLLAYSPDGTLIVRGRRAGRAVPSGAGAAGDPGRASGVRATGFLAGA